MDYVRWLDEGDISRSEGGGKAASLSALIGGGFPVPMGFCITEAAYRRFEEQAGLSAKITKLLNGVDSADRQASRVAYSQVEALWQGQTLPVDVAEAVALAYEELSAETGLAVAVRSSAVSEDGGKASFAGSYESFLNVQGSAGVVEAVLSCYRSLCLERAIRYRVASGGAVDRESMAVVVQGLVPCESAGVAFTAHPVTGELSKVVINANWGLGESVVSGVVAPDYFVLAKDGLGIIERQIGAKAAAIVSRAGSGTEEQALSQERASLPSLSDAQAQAVAALAMRAEAMFGSPQDIEWGLAGGELYLLQSRPITTL